METIQPADVGKPSCLRFSHVFLNPKPFTDQVHMIDEHFKFYFKNRRSGVTVREENYGGRLDKLLKTPLTCFVPNFKPQFLIITAKKKQMKKKKSVEP